MWASLRKHPITSAVAAICIFLLWNFPQWLGDVWPLFSQKTIPQWLAERRWPGMNPELSSWLTLGIDLAMLGLLVAIYFAARRQRDATPHAYVGSIDVSFRELSTGGYIQLTISLICCTTGLRVEHVPVGTIRCKVGESPSVALDSPTIDFPVDLNLRAGESSIILKQHIAPALATRIAEALTQPEYSVEFSFHTLTLNVLSAETPPTRVTLWDGIACRPGMTCCRILELSSEGVT
jgi:hypothetical protein